MLDALISQFDKLVEQFSWRRLVFLVIVATIILGCLFFYESYTQHFRLERISEEAGLLNRLEAQQLNLSTNSNTNIININKGLIQQLNNMVNPSGEFNWGWTVKILCAAIPWMLLVFFFYITAKLEKNTLGGILVSSVPICIIAAFLPTFSHKWINYVVYPWGMFFMVLFLMWRFSELKKEYKA